MKKTVRQQPCNDNSLDLDAKNGYHKTGGSRNASKSEKAMCEDLEATLDLLEKTGADDMSSSARIALRQTVSSLKKQGTKLTNFIEETRKNFDELRANQANMSEQIQNNSSITAESMKRINEIYEMLKVDKIEEKAALVDWFQRFINSKFGKICIGIMFVSLIALGVAAIYLIDHYSEVSQLVEAVK